MIKTKKQNPRKDNIKKLIRDIVLKREDISHLRKQVEGYKRSSGRSSGSSKLFQLHLDEIQNQFDLQQRIIFYMEEPFVSDETIEELKPLIRAGPTQELFQALLDKKKLIEDAEMENQLFQDCLDLFRADTVDFFEDGVEGLDVSIAKADKAEKELEKVFNNFEELKTHLLLYANNPYKDDQKFLIYKTRLTELHKRLDETILISSESNQFNEDIPMLLSPDDFSSSETSEYNRIKKEINEETSLSRLERKYLLEKLEEQKSLFADEDDVIGNLLSQEMLKTHDEFEYISDVEDFRDLLEKYKQTLNADIHILFQAVAFLCVLEKDVLPVLKLKNQLDIRPFEKFFKSPKQLKYSDIAKLKSMLDEIPATIMMDEKTSQKLELYRLLYTYLSAEYELKQGLEGDLINLQSSAESSLPDEDSWKTYQTRDTLLNQKLHNIPVILVGIHGGIRYSEEGNCLETFESPLLLIRYIAAAPGETTTNCKVSPFYLNLLKNKIVQNPNSTVDEALKQRHKSCKFDKKTNKLAYFYARNSREPDTVGTNINFKSRNQVVINYQGSKICKKYLVRDVNPKWSIYVLNNTRHLALGTNLMTSKVFIDYLNSKKGANQRMSYMYDVNEKQIDRLTNKDLYEFLHYLGYTQAVIIDEACESSIDNPYVKLSQEMNVAVAKMNTLLNLDKNTSELLINLTERNLFRNDPLYVAHKAKMTTIRKKALRKSKRHRATLAQDSKGHR